MFGRKKKRYIKKFDPPSVGKPSSTDDKGGSSHKLDYQKKNTYNDLKRKKTPDSYSTYDRDSDFSNLIAQDSLMLKKERINWSESNQYTEDSAVPTSQKSAKKVLLIVCFVICFKYLSILMSANIISKNSQSTIGIFFIFIPFIIGAPLIYAGVFYAWKHFLKPLHRVILRKVFPYWKWILFALYLIYIKNIFSSFNLALL